MQGRVGGGGGGRASGGILAPHVPSRETSALTRKHTVGCSYILQGLLCNCDAGVRVKFHPTDNADYHCQIARVTLGSDTV